MNKRLEDRDEYMVERFGGCLYRITGTVEWAQREDGTPYHGMEWLERERGHGYIVEFLCSKRQFRRHRRLFPHGTAATAEGRFVTTKVLRGQRIILEDTNLFT